MLFVDIETVAMKESFELLDDQWKALWTRYHDARFEGEPATTFKENAAFTAEFGRAACVGVGMVVPNSTGIGSAKIFRATAFASVNESAVLQWFASIMSRSKAAVPICGHNATSFDFPFLCRRMSALRMALPSQLAVAMGGEKKPWEIPWRDTMKMWACGDFKANTRLELVASVLGIPNPKAGMDGSKIHHKFFVEKDLVRIQRYCVGDVVTTAKVYHMLTGTEFPGEVMEVDSEPSA